MESAIIRASHIFNALASPEQLASSGSQLDGVPADLESSIIYAGARLTQIAGVLLRLPQEVVAQAIVIFSRFWIGSEGGSLREHGASDVSAASLYLAAKMSDSIRTLRSVINVYAYLDSCPALFGDADHYAASVDSVDSYVSEGSLEIRRARLTQVEATILQVLGFDVLIALPHTLCVNYLQTLGVFNRSYGSTSIAQRALAHLNSALFSPQLLYLTHQPSALATAAIYLAAKEVGVKLPACEWWEVFDTDREELGFLVVAMISMDGFAQQEKEKWYSRRIPLTVEELDAELEQLESINSS